MRGREIRRGYARACEPAKTTAAATGRCGAERHCLRTPQPATGTACHHVGVGTAGTAGRRATTGQTAAGEHQTSMQRRSISLPPLRRRAMLTAGRAETTSVIDTINRRATKGGFPVLIHTNPNKPIRHSATQPDCNCRCNLDRCLNVRTRFFPPNSLRAGPVERAPV